MNYFGQIKMLGVFLPLALVAQASASVIDQDNLWVANPDTSLLAWSVGALPGFAGLGQTFIAGRNGTLDTVSLELAVPKSFEAAVAFGLSVYTTTDGLPTGQALATQYFEFDDSFSTFFDESTLLTLDFLGDGVAMTSGDEYALILDPLPGAPGYGFWVATTGNQVTTDPYENGRALFRRHDDSWMFSDLNYPGLYDFGFSTSVVPVPAPASLALFGSALLVLFRSKVQRKHRESNQARGGTAWLTTLCAARVGS